MSCFFRQVDEKHVSSEVELMLWSSRMDLIAISNVQGEVLLHRLSWKKVWGLAPPGEGVKVTGLAWRPDGKVLAVGYDNNDVLLVDIEDAAVLHTIHTPSPVRCVSWVSQPVPEADQDPVPQTDTNSASTYLPPLPPFQKTYSQGKGKSDEAAEDSKKLKDQKYLNILLVGSEGGHLNMYAHGVFPVATIDLCKHLNSQDCVVTSSHLSTDLSVLSVVIETNDDDNTKVFSLLFDVSLLSSRHKELQTLAFKFGQILTLMAYLSSTIQQMKEAWEDILLEMDSKLIKFAEEKKKLNSGSVSNDLLRLLMFGTPSDELQSFLLHELTEKGLKKLGHSIETSYSNIQKLVLKHLQSVGQALVYHISEVNGLSLWYDKYSALGLVHTSVQHAVKCAGAFMLKASELQQVIDGSMKNFKAFFRWLYVVIQRLSDEPIPAELSKMTQQDLNFVAQFLKENFTESCSSHKSGFKLERVGQYLKDCDLLDPPDNGSNPWVCYLDNQRQINSGMLYYEQIQAKKSLIQMHQVFKDSVESVTQECQNIMSNTIHCVATTLLYTRTSEETSKKYRLTQFSKQTSDGPWIYSAFTVSTPPCDKCYVLRQRNSDTSDVGATCLEFGCIGSQSCQIDDLNMSDMSGERCTHHSILDISCYDDDTISFLLQQDSDNNFPVLVQLPLSTIQHAFIPSSSAASVLPVTDWHNIPCVDVGPLTDNMNHRILENMKASIFSVSGTRKVACVLFSSRRRVRLFLMDAEDEDDDDDENETTIDVTNNDLTNTSTNLADDENKENENSF